MKQHRFFLSVVILLVGAGLFWFFGQESEPERIQSNEELAMLEQQALAPEPEPEPAAQSQDYSLEFDVTWSVETHPETLPAGPHVSPFVAVVHKTPGSVIQRGTRATSGLELIAETGATGTFAAELDMLIAAGEVLEYSVGQRIDAPGTDSVDLRATQEFPYLTVVSMIAPSPDWLVASVDFPLFNGQQWAIDNELGPQYLDAGTDDGTTFTAANRDNPVGVVGAQINDSFIAATTEAGLGLFRLSSLSDN